MALRRVPLAPNEWFHCYTRGVEGRVTFEMQRDYERFIESLYLCNSSLQVRRDDLKQTRGADIFLHPRGNTLVDIGAYCLMPNHFHILLRARSEGGVARFMQKIGTAYTMYFNIKNKRVGGLFVTPFRSKHITDDDYFKRVAQYIHLNPVELFEPRWKLGSETARRRLAVIEKKIKEYPYGSLPEYSGSKRPEMAVLDSDAFDLIRGEMPTLSSVLEEASLYYKQLAS